MPPVQGVFPTRMTLTLYKGKQVGAQKGYDLLKKKADALAVRLRALLKEIKETKLAVGRHRPYRLLVHSRRRPDRIRAGRQGDERGYLCH